MAEGQRLALMEAAGMTIASDVLDEHGQCLLAAGSLLTARQLELLRARGIATVEVDAGPDDEARREARCAQMRERLERRFDRVIDQPLMNELLQTLVDYREKALQCRK